MNRYFSNVDPRALDNANSLIAIEDRRIKERIDVLREQGFSDDDILLILFREKSSDNQKVKTKYFISDSYFYNK